MWVGLKNADDAGIRFDLLAKVYVNGAPVGSGQLDSVSGGSTGFTGAQLDAIPLVLAAPIQVSSGDTLSIELLARNACSGSGKNFGTARLWYNGQPIDSGPSLGAGSRFDATIGGLSIDFFLRAGFALSATPGSSPLFADAEAGAKCGPFSSFRVWTSHEGIRLERKNPRQVGFH